MERQDIILQQKNQPVSQNIKFEYENVDEVQVQKTLSDLIQQNQRLLAQINNIARNRKNKNIISPQMSFLTNKLERNLVKIARIVPPEALADPQHVKDQKQRFLKFYRGRNAPKKPLINLNQPIMNNNSGNTPTKLTK